MSIDIARRLAQALDVKSESRIRSINRALTDYVRLTPQAATTLGGGDIDASQVVSGTFDDGRIAESNVTQHEAALEITEIQISDLGAYIESGDSVDWTGSHSFGSRVELVRDSQSLTANTHDLSVAGSRVVIELDADGNYDLTGIANPTNNRICYVLNADAANTITLKHNNAGSNAVNRFFLPGSADLVLQPRSGVMLIYASSVSKWYALTP